MLIDDVSKIIKAYFGATGLPVFYINQAENPLHFLQFPDYTSLTNYFDLGEVLSFIRPAFDRIADVSDRTTYHTFHTQNYFVYNIVLTAAQGKTNGAIISGPILVYSPDDKRFEEILAHNRMPLRKKPELKEMVNKLPHATMEQIDHYGRLLLALSTSRVQKWAGARARMHGTAGIGAAALFGEFADTAVYHNESNGMYKRIYNFIISFKDKIKHGETSGLSELLNKSLDILWYTDASKDAFNAIRSNCAILCALSCIYAIQARAPMEIMLKLQYEFQRKIQLLKTTNDIVSCMMAIAGAYAHAVAVLADNAYSLHVNRALLYMRNHYTEDITLGALADYARVSPIYLSGLIKKETHLSLSDNVNKIRIAQSKNLLIHTDRTLNEIAHTVGYNYQNHFSRIFKKFTGITPLEFRKKYGQNTGA